MRLDLIDEFRRDLHPYVAGEGTRPFDDVPVSYRLDLAPRSATGSSGSSTAGTANPAADMHDEWQSGKRQCLSEGSIAPNARQRCCAYTRRPAPRGREGGRARPRAGAGGVRASRSTAVSMGDWGWMTLGPYTPDYLKDSGPVRASASTAQPHVQK
jgi:hypothetical protein